MYPQNLYVEAQALNVMVRKRGAFRRLLGFDEDGALVRGLVPL